jgi:amino acid transporter
VSAADTPTAAPTVTQADVGPILEKGLKTGALGFVSSVVIGVASTAPGYSLAASLGGVVLAVGLQAPAALLVGFIPMFLIAGSYYSMNRVDPDCGTTFTWVTRAIGPYSGWIAGWALLLADILVMASLSQIAGTYTFLLVGANSLANSVFWVTVVGVIWIVLMTYICYVGIEVSAKTQWFLLAAEIFTLMLFAVVALAKVYAGDFKNSVDPSWSWFNPFAVSTGALTAGVLIAFFIYWGWDTAVAVNEETEDATRTPGRAAVVSTLLLLGIYAIVSVAAISVHGPQFLINNTNDVLSPLGQAVLPSGLDKLLIIAVLTSASASTQTTILPGTRAALSMATHGAAPKAFASINPRRLTPGYATIWFGAISIAYYVILTSVSGNILLDSVTATVLMVTFYLGITGFACVIYFRKALFNDLRTFLLAGLGPGIGAIMMTYIFIRSAIDQYKVSNSYSGKPLLGMGAPFTITLLGLGLGVVLILIQRAHSGAFFKRRRLAASSEMRL